jgi:hypothetical protein
MVGEGLPEIRTEVQGILSAIQARIGRTDVLLTPNPPTDESQPPREPEQVFVYADSTRTKLTQGTPLLVTARCDDSALWPSIRRAFGQEEFEPFGDASTVGTTRAQCFISRTRAWFVAPENPSAKMAIERTGKSVLGWISPPAPYGYVWRAHPTTPPTQEPRARS